MWLIFTENLIRGLDDDEVEFLDLVDRTKMDAEKKQMMEEEKELNDFRQRVVTLQEKSLDEVSKLFKGFKTLLLCFYTENTVREDVS